MKANFGKCLCIYLDIYFTIRTSSDNNLENCTQNDYINKPSNWFPYLISLSFCCIFHLSIYQ